MEHSDGSSLQGQSATLPFPGRRRAVTGMATKSTPVGSSTEGPAEAEITARFIDDVSPYLQVLAGVARRYARNPRDAEDLVQETLLKAYMSFHSFREGTNLKAWLFQIMRRTWIDAHRAAQRRPVEVLTEQFTDSVFVSGHSALVSASAETELLRANLGEGVRQALFGLAEPLRIVIFYADIEGRTYRDIATLLNIPLGTVMSRIHRGRQRLRAQLSRAGVVADELMLKRAE